MIGSSTVVSAFSYSAAASMNCVSRNSRLPCRLRLRPSSCLHAAPSSAAITTIAMRTERDAPSEIRLMWRGTIHSRVG